MKTWHDKRKTAVLLWCPPLQSVTKRFRFLPEKRSNLMGNNQVISQ